MQTRARDQRDGEHRVAGKAERLRAVGQAERDDQVERRTGRHRRDAAEQHLLPVLREHFDERHLDLRGGFLDLAERRRFRRIQADIKPDADEQRAGEERNAPAPREQRFGRHDGVADQKREIGDQRAGGNADLHPRAVQSALAWRARARPPSARRRPIRRRARDPESTRSVSSRMGAQMPIDCVVRQQADGERGNTHVTSETSSIDLRPSRSPKWPNSAAPTIRAR